MPLAVGSRHTVQGVLGRFTWGGAPGLLRGLEKLGLFPSKIVTRPIFYSGEL